MYIYILKIKVFTAYLILTMLVSQENINFLSAILYGAQNKYIMGILCVSVPSLNSQNVYHIFKTLFIRPLLRLIWTIYRCWLVSYLNKTACSKAYRWILKCIHSKMFQTSLQLYKIHFYSIFTTKYYLRLNIWNILQR
jgi:hypothetical protein